MKYKNTNKTIGIVSEYAVIYGLGALIYSLLEIMWRGFTHWTMALTGGLCLVCIYSADRRKPYMKLWKKCLHGCTVITFFELAVGCIVNRMLNWHVWDYSERFLNVLGQICPLYSAIWFILSIPAVFICSIMRNKVFSLFHKEKIGGFYGKKIDKQEVNQ